MKNTNKLFLALAFSVASIGTAFANDDMPMKDGSKDAPPAGMGDKMKQGQGKGMGMKDKGMGMKDKAQKTETANSAETDNCVMMKDGKMMAMTDGKSESMKSDVKLNDGTSVKKDGTVIAKDGSKTALKEGDMVTMDGKRIDASR